MRSVVAVDKRRTLAARGVTAGAVGLAAVYTMTNSSGGNAIEAYSRGSTGSLTPAGTYPTGGDGRTLGSGHSIVVSQDGSVVVNGAVTPPGATPTDPGTIDAAVSSDGQYLYVQAGGPGRVDGYRIGPGESLARTGSVAVPGAAGGEHRRLLTPASARHSGSARHLDAHH